MEKENPVFFDLSVLYIEDDLMTRKMGEGILKKMVSRIYSAESGEDGYALFLEKDPDIIVTDIRLPGISGLEMARQARLVNQSVPVIVTTAYNETDLVIEAVDIGINQFVPKPLDRRKLRNALERCMGILRLKQTIHTQEAHIRMLSHALENSPSISLISDREGIIEYVNHKFVEVTGYTADEVIGKSVSILKSGYHSQHFYRTLWETIQQGKEWRGEICNRKKNGEIYWGWVSISSLDEQDDTPFRYVAVMEDITERKKVEAALQTSEQKYKELADSLPQTVFEMDDRGQFTFVNQAAYRLFGYSEEDIVRGLTIYDLLDFSEHKRARREFETILTKQTVSNPEFKAIRKNKTPFPVAVYAGVILQDGKPVGIRGLIVDMTEQKEAEERIRYLSFHDSLTGTYNRAYFEEEMERLADGRYDPVGLILCDVNFLKMANDSLGHQVGDQLLKEVGRILRQTFRKNDVVARVGGDEFAVLLPRTSRQALERGCQRIQRFLTQYNQQKPAFPLSLSVGYAVREDLFTKMKDLYRQADNRMYQHKNLSRHNALPSLAENLLKSLEATQDSHERLEKMMVQVGLKLELAREVIERLRLLAKYHNIGRGGICQHVLSKEGDLTPQEKEEIRQHVEIGYRVALTLPDLSPIADLILKHHEWWNGQGYPLGLKGEEIPIESRILSVVDAYQAMTSDRPFRKAKTSQEALREIEREAGLQFDPRVVQEFTDLIRENGFHQVRSEAGKR